MRRIVAIIAASFAFSVTSAEEFTCAYKWPTQTELHTVVIEVDGQIAKLRGGFIDLEFLVAANSTAELLLYYPYTKERSGADYPVGFTTIAVDKKSGELIYSNAFVGGRQTNHAIGSCNKHLTVP